MIGRGGSVLKAAGTAARHELEALLGHACAPRDAGQGRSRLAAAGRLARPPRPADGDRSPDRSGPLVIMRVPPRSASPGRRCARVEFRRIDGCRVRPISCRDSSPREADVGPHAPVPARRRDCRHRNRRRHAGELWRQHRAEQQAERAAPGRPVRAQDPRPDRAVLLDRGRRRARRHRRHVLRRVALPGEAGRRARAEAGARQHRARDQLDRHPRGDPRDHGGARPSRRSSASPRSRSARTSCTSRSPRGSGGGSSRTPTRATSVETANELHIPVGQPVSLTLQTPTCSPTPCYHNGVIHSFWIPALNGKKDVVPGRTQFLKLEADKPGVYLGPVRGVLRALARRHAHARDRADAGRLPGLGAEPTARRRPRRPRS